MNNFCSFLVGLLTIACAIHNVSSDRPLDHNYVSILDEKDGEQNYRLPNNTIPETYDITLTTRVDKKDSNFSGTVIIQLIAIESSNSITIHQRQLNILTQKLKKINTNSDISLEVSYDKTTELLTFKTGTLLEKDQKYLLTITYSGELRKDKKGFYLAEYLYNGKHYFATTQFESTDARHAFPCYDEPGLKAQFTIRIYHGPSYNAISNMPGTTTDAENGLKVTNFETTPVMSTYLIAFIVSNFKYNEIPAGIAENPTIQRVYTSVNKLNQTTYALNEGVSLLNSISSYLDVPFSLKKMDQVAIPNDYFSAGAMENWGLVTYRDAYLLYDENVHLSSRKLDVSTTISHEFGHQWFGNLVTPKWWTHIWLNEGFATLFEYFGTGLVHTDWNIFNYFVVNVLQPVLRIDAASTTRAMNTYAESPAGVASLFDRIAYWKSGSVLRMFQHALTENTFKKGLKYYLIEKYVIHFSKTFS